jgi:hypothetical protein
MKIDIEDRQLTGVKATEIPGFSEHASSGQVLTVAGILGSVYDEITAK